MGGLQKQRNRPKPLLLSEPVGMDLDPLPPSGKKRRPKIPKKIRRIVYSRDKFRCQHCGLQMSEGDSRLTCDHVIPLADNGPTTVANLVTSCYDCNIDKGCNDAAVVRR